MRKRHASQYANFGSLRLLINNSCFGEFSPDSNETGMLKQNYFLADIFILSAEKQPIKLSWRKIE